MLKNPKPRCPKLPFHIVTRSHNREWFPVEMPKVWEVCLAGLRHAGAKYHVELINFVLMNNHYHMMLKTPHENLDLFVYEFNKFISNELRKEIFEDKYKWCMIRSPRYLTNCYRYVYQNPLRAGVVREAQDYPYSTLHYLKHKKDFPLQIYDHFGFKDEYGLRWINETVKEPEAEAIRRGLQGSRSLYFS